ncbi:MAG: R2-like ligand-binding oxidase [Planctomycetes bacterium]|nr:R2-like ligand-binding oxidase [Planctomycetota bacterium]
MAAVESERTGFKVTTKERLDRESFPMRLFQKAKKLGTWDPAGIDFSGDRARWHELSDVERDALLRLTSLFAAGEESVTLDLLPLVQAIAREGRIEEEIYLTSFLWEEAKHVEFFAHFLDEVVGEGPDLHTYHTPCYRKIFYEELPRAMGRLAADPSPETQARASVTYNMIVEGVLAETGYHSYFTAIESRGSMPGLVEGLALVKRDESRHIAYGVYLLSRLAAERASLWPIMEERMNELLPHALGLIGEIFESYDPMPFGLAYDEFAAYATSQFTKRLDRIRRSVGKNLDEVAREALAEV